MANLGDNVEQGYENDENNEEIPDPQEGGDNVGDEPEEPARRRPLRG